MNIINKTINSHILISFLVVVIQVWGTTSREVVALLFLDFFLLQYALTLLLRG